MIPQKILEYSHSHPIVFFDGYCMLCEHWILRLVKADKASILRFSPLQQLQGLSTESILLVENGKVLSNAKAVLRLSELTKVKDWRIKILAMMPDVMAKLVYQLTAKTRFILYGKKAQCSISTKNSAQIAPSLFLDISKI